MMGGEATNTICLLSSVEDWAKFGQVQQSLMGDPEMQAAMLEAGQLATWETYVSQTIPDSQIRREPRRSHASRPRPPARR